MTIELPAFVRLKFDRGNVDGEAKIAGDKAGLEFKRSFDGQASAIRGVIQEALSAPRNSQGALNLGADAIREAAQAEQARAASARELAAATRAAFAAEKDLNTETRLSIVAAEKVARQYEKNAAALLRQADAADKVQAELNRTGSAAGSLVTGYQAAEKGSGRLRQATVQVGQQFQDFAVQVQGGQSIAVAFTQQASQLGFILSQLDGSTNKTAAAFGRFGSLLAGPLGLPIIFAVGGAISLLTDFFTKQDAATVKAQKSTFDFTQAIDSSKQSLSTYAEFIGQLTSATKGLISTQALLADSTARTAQATVANTQAELSRVRAQIAALSKDLDGGIATSNPFNIGVNIEKAIRRNSLRGTEKLLTQSLASAQASVAESSVALSIRRVEETFDKAAKIKGEADRQIALLTQQRVQSANAENALKANKVPFAGAFGPGSKGFISQLDFEKQILKIKQAQKVEEDKLTESKKRAGQADREIAAERRRQINADLPTFRQLRSIVREDFPGARVTSDVRSRATQERLFAAFRAGRGNIAARPGTSFHERGQAIDIAKGNGVNLESVRASLAKRGLVPTELIDEGNIIHVAVQRGKADLLDYADATREAQKATRQLDNDLEKVGRRFDESTAAGIKYDETIAAIERLSAAGKITPDQKTLFTTDAIRDFYEAEIAAADKAAAEIQSRFFKGFEDGFSPLADEAADSIGDKTEAAIKAALERAVPKLEAAGFKALDGISRTLGNGPASLLASLSKNARDGDQLNGFLNELGKGYDDANKRLAAELNSIFNDIFKVGGPFAATLGSALAGAQTGSQVASIGKSLGVKTSKLGGQIGGSVGAASGIPGGELIGSIIGSVVGGLFKKTPKGNVAISNSGSSFTGSGKLRSGLTGTGDSVIDSLSAIAEQLGGSVGTFSTSIRQKKNSFFVGQQKFGSAQEAAEAATLQLIQQGVINGLDAGTQRLISSGKNLEAGLKKALSFQSALDRIKESTDPLGAALGKIGREFTALRSTFTDAGATAEQFAGLAALEAKERQAALESITASLRDLQRENSFGDTGRSLRDRQAAALAAFNPLEARVRAGDATAFDPFAEVGRQLRDINREIFGSQGGYFEFLDRLQATTNAAIAGQENIAGLNATAAPVVSALDRQTDALISALTAVNDNTGNSLVALREISATLASGGRGVSINQQTFFA